MRVRPLLLRYGKEGQSVFMRLSEGQWTALASKIPERQLLAFRLVYSEGRTHKQAANMMGISRVAVVNLIKRLKAKYPDCIPKNTNLVFEPYTKEFERTEEKAKLIKEKY